MHVFIVSEYKMEELKQMIDHTLLFVTVSVYNDLNHEWTLNTVNF